MAQIVHGQQRDRLGCERRGQMPAHAIRVLRIGTAAFEIALVAVERFADRDRAVRIIGAGLTACQRPRYIDGLPISQNVLAVRGFKIVGQSDALDPVGAVAVGATYGPGAAPDVAPVAQPDAGRDRRRKGLLAYCQAATGCRGFELGGARLRHLAWSPCPMKCPEERRTLAWTAIERHEGSRDAPTLCCYP